MYQRANNLTQWISASCRCSGNFGRGRRINRSPQCRTGAAMKVKLPVRRAVLHRKTYEAPEEGRENKIRLDFNENTSGCSPAVIRALARLTPRQIAMYPEVQNTIRQLAKYFKVSPQELLLTNG